MLNRPSDRGPVSRGTSGTGAGAGTVACSAGAVVAARSDVHPMLTESGTKNLKLLQILSIRSRTRPTSDPPQLQIQSSSVIVSYGARPVPRTTSVALFAARPGIAVEKTREDSLDPYGGHSRGSEAREQ